MSPMQARVVVVASGLAASLAGAAGGEPIKALLITGHNNHNWQYTSRLHEETLEATGRFDVDVTDDPQTTLADAAGLKQYQLFVLDYNDSHSPRRWGEAAEKNFLEAVSAGTGVAAIHSANNAFKGWTEYEKMLGLMWREGTGHGKFHRFTVEVVDQAHPVFHARGPVASAGSKEAVKKLESNSGSPVTIESGGTAAWSKFETDDELYHKLVNEHGSKYRLLARAMSSKESGGTGEYEPMAFTLEYGKGRVFATPLGHVWNGSDDQKASISNEMFKTMLVRGAEWATTGTVTQAGAWSDVREHNTLSEQEKKDGWRLLFDGKTPAGWRGFKKGEFPGEGWSVSDGVLTHVAGKGGGDIVTTDQFKDFEFACDWKVATGGNSGIMYRCTEDHSYPWETGPECQILDDGHHADGKKPKTRAGTLYDIVACGVDVSRPAGEWNRARVVVNGTRIEHWLNGFKVVDIDMASEEFKKAHAASKWPGMPDYGKRAEGHIALQDHGDEVQFRNVKVRVIR